MSRGHRFGGGGLLGLSGHHQEDGEHDQSRPRPAGGVESLSEHHPCRGHCERRFGREIYIDYGPSIGQSKLILPKKVCTGTARNWNTVLKLNDMLSE